MLFWWIVLLIMKGNNYYPTPTPRFGGKIVKMTAEDDPKISCSYTLLAETSVLAGRKKYLRTGGRRTRFAKRRIVFCW